MAEEKEVNDTGLEVEEETPQPTIDPVTGEVKEPEEKGSKGVEAEGENWEKRYKDLQSHSDKTLADRDKEIGRYKGLVSPFQKNIREIEGGGLKFDFSETSSEDKKPPEEIKEPEKDLWITDPEAATKQQIAYDREQDRKARQAEKDAQKATDGDAEFEKSWNASWVETQKLYPDMKNEDSELFKVAKAILDKDPAMAESPNCNFTVAKLAAAELGIAPVKEAAPEKKKDTSYIIGGSSGGGGKTAKKLSDAEFVALSHDEQTEYMKTGYMKEE